MLKLLTYKRQFIKFCKTIIFFLVHDNTGVWFVKLDQKTPTGPITIVATSHVNSREQSINLTDVLFGDVWICGGEHNMEMPVRWVSKMITFWPSVRHVWESVIKNEVNIKEFILIGFWFLPSSLLINLLVRKWAALVCLLIYTIYFMFFVSVYLVFRWKILPKSFNCFFSSLLLYIFCKTYLNLVCLSSKSAQKFSCRNLPVCNKMTHADWLPSR